MKKLSKEARKLLTYDDAHPVRWNVGAAEAGPPTAEEHAATTGELTPSPTGIWLPPGMYWADLIPQTPRWLEALDAYGLDGGAVDEWLDSHKEYFFAWAEEHGVKILRWDLEEAGGFFGKRVFFSFEVTGDPVHWGPDQIRYMGAIPSPFKGDKGEIPTNENTGTVPETLSVAERLEQVAIEIAKKAGATAALLLGVGFAFVFAWATVKANALTRTT